jgi:hypothetical protein
MGIFSMCPACGNEYSVPFECACVKDELAKAQAEIERLKAGRFTPVEIHDICHNLHGTVDALGFAEGCIAEQRKLYGCAPYKDKMDALEAKLEGLGRVWQQMKALTKQYPAREWNEEYRELAGIIHAIGRDFFYVELKK